MYSSWDDGRILLFIACFLHVCAFGIATVQRVPVMAALSISCGGPSMPVLSALRGTIRRLWALVSKEFRYMSIRIMIDHTVCEWDYFPTLNVFIWPFIRWLNVAKMRLCFSEDYLCVAATSEVHKWVVTASSEDQCLCDVGLLAEIWCLHRNCGCYIAHYHQLLLLEKDTQVRVHYLKWYLKQKTNLDQKLVYLLFTLTPSNKIVEVENKAAYCWNDLGLIWSNERVNKDWWIIDGKVFFPQYY